MDLKLATEISKCLANQTRIEILEWLKNPVDHFPPHTSIDHFDDGVCATYIYEKTGLSQSTISNYLTNMEKCGLVTLTRHGKWSYFKRNQELIDKYLAFLK